MSSFSSSSLVVSPDPPWLRMPPMLIASRSAVGPATRKLQLCQACNVAPCWTTFGYAPGEHCYFFLLLFFFGCKSESLLPSNATNVTCVTFNGGSCNAPVAAVLGLQVGTMLDNIWICFWSCVISWLCFRTTLLSKWGVPRVTRPSECASLPVGACWAGLVMLPLAAAGTTIGFARVPLHSEPNCRHVVCNFCNCSTGFFDWAAALSANATACLHML